VLALFPRLRFYSKVMAVVSVHDLMPQALGPILKTILFTIVVPGFVTVGAPYLLLGGFPAPGRSPLAWLGPPCIVIGASIYFSCAWEFAVRGLGTPAPIAPTKLLVVSGWHRYVRNPMYIGVARGHGRSCSVSCSSAGCLCGVPLLAGLYSLSFSTRNPRSIASSARRTTNTAAPSRAGFRDSESDASPCRWCLKCALTL
jgi:hypothetical protein